mgnify:CR=1 FL=1
MNNHFLFILIVTLFFIACSDENGQIISNTPPDLPDQNYKLNLQSDSGENLTSVTISWNEINSEVTLFDSNISSFEVFKNNNNTFFVTLIRHAPCPINIIP